MVPLESNASTRPLCSESVAPETLSAAIVPVRR